MRRHVIVLIGVLLALAACTGGPWAAPPPVASPQPPRLPATSMGPHGVQAAWVIQENQRPGTTAWRITATPPGSIEGFADRTYAADGDNVMFRVSTTASQYHVEAYRVGDYGGTGARLVWTSGVLAGTRQPDCPMVAGVNKVACANWSPSLRVRLSTDFVPGDYLFKLVGNDGQQSYVPLTVWDPASHATYVLKNDVLTWQAWNPYGGFDYYEGKGACPPGVYPLCSRARVVSFDRPYDFGDLGGQGTGDFLHLELPLVQWAERNGLDLTYVTDLTVIDHPQLLTAHKAMFSLGHDECWELREREAAVAAHDAGVNIAFFGASAVLRHVRVQDSVLGPNREVVDYRDSAADPANGHGDPRQVTGNTWANAPASWPEEDFVGEAYNGFLEPGAQPAGLQITEGASWIFAGTGLRDGAVVPGVIGSDVDSLEPQTGHPATVEVLAHSALDASNAQARTHVGNRFYSDMTYYTDPHGQGGVWDSGTNDWIPDLTPCPAGRPCPADVVGAITGNLLKVFGQGPAGMTQPSQPNWQHFAPNA